MLLSFNPLTVPKFLPAAVSGGMRAGASDASLVSRATP
jgi:hypothetical protein